MLMKGITTSPYCDRRAVAQRLLIEWPNSRKDDISWKTVRSYILDVFRTHPDEALKNQCLDMWSNWQRTQMDALVALARSTSYSCSHSHELEWETVWVEIKPY